jgi:hypothetical protein
VYGVMSPGEVVLAHAIVNKSAVASAYLMAAEEPQNVRVGQVGRVVQEKTT